MLTTAVTIRVRPHQPKQSDQRIDLASSGHCQVEGELVLAVLEITDDRAERRRSVLRGYDRFQDALDSLDRVVPGVRWVGVAAVTCTPCGRKLVADRLGRDLDTAEARIVDARLADAELLITSRIPDLTAQVTAGAIDPAAVAMVESDAVLRLIRDPEGYVTETDGNYSCEIDQRVATSRLVILDNEWVLLGVRAEVFTIAPRLHVPGDCFGDYWWHHWMDPDDTAVWA